MGIMTKAVAAVQTGLIQAGNAMVTAGIRFQRPDTISAFMGTVDGRVARNQNGDRFVISPRSLRQLATYDPITGSIIRKFKGRISKMKWSVGVDCQKQIQDLHRLEKLAAGYLSPYRPDGWVPDFKSEVLPPDIVKYLWTQLTDLDPNQSDSRKRARWLFDQMETELQSQNAGPAYRAEQFLQNINQDNLSPFKYTLERWIEDLCVVDAAAGPKVLAKGGDILECYSIPGEEITRYINPDLSTPQAPYRAYRWERNGRMVADYTRDDLLYMVKNPQPNGYGFSPVELSVNIILASLYADTFNLDSFRDNIPPAILDLGPVTDQQRQRFRTEFLNEMNRGGKHRMMFINTSKDGKLSFTPMTGLSQRDMEYIKYLKWTLSIKCMCFGMSPQDIGFVEDFHKTTAETQQAISNEGTLDMADFLEEGLTAGLVRPYFGKDLRFGFIRDQQVMSKEQAEVHKIYLDKGILSPNQVLGMIGQRPLTDGGDQPYIATTTGIVPVSEIFSLDGNIELDSEVEDMGADDGIDTSEEKPIKPRAGAAPKAESSATRMVTKALKSMRGEDRKTTDSMREVVKLAKANRAARLERYRQKLKAKGERIQAEAVEASKGQG